MKRIERGYSDDNLPSKTQRVISEVDRKIVELYQQFLEVYSPKWLDFGPFPWTVAQLKECLGKEGRREFFLDWQTFVESRFAMLQYLADYDVDSGKKFLDEFYSIFFLYFPTLDKFPKEVLLHICQFLSYQDLVRLSLVARVFRDSCQHSSLLPAKNPQRLMRDVNALLRGKKLQPVDYFKKKLVINEGSLPGETLACIYRFAREMPRLEWLSIWHLDEMEEPNFASALYSLRLKKLTVLSASGDVLQGLTGIDSLRVLHLEFLEISEEEVDGFAQGLTQFSRLEELMITFNPDVFTGTRKVMTCRRFFHTLGSLSQLRRFRFITTDNAQELRYVKNFASPLALLQNLEEVELDLERIRDVNTSYILAEKLPQLRGLRKMHFAFESVTRECQEPISSALTSAPNLEHVVLETRVSLMDTAPFIEATLNKLTSAPRLEHLDLLLCGIENEDLASVGRVAEKLSRLRTLQTLALQIFEGAYECMAPIVDAIRSCPHLQELRLTLIGNEQSPPTGAFLPLSSKVVELDLSGRFPGILRDVVRFPELRKLRLYTYDVEIGKILELPPAIAPLAQLRTLDFGKSALTEEIYAAFVEIIQEVNRSRSPGNRLRLKRGDRIQV